MKKYMIAYHGGKRPSSKEEGMAHMVNWKNWIADLENRVVNSGTPLQQSKLITAETSTTDTSSNSMNGFAIIQAQSFEEAEEIAKNDPFLKMDGTIRLSEMMDMPN